MRLTVALYKLKSGTAAATLSLCLSASVLADDIDVYTAQIAAQKKPNILFVLDYSGSMGWDIYGNNARRFGNESRLDILKGAMHELLDKNHDRINAGIGSLYSTTTTGIRWPISELSADANTVDPDIPAGQFHCE